MPELPEVETIKKGLEKTILNKKIADFIIFEKKFNRFDTKKLRSALIGNKIANIARAGKLLIFNLASQNKFLLIHLKMTGQLIYKKSGSNLLPDKFNRALFVFADKSILYFNDMRRFGYIKIATEEEKNKILNEGFGIDPLGEKFTLLNFKKILARRKTKIKSFLMDQRLIAGIGNIYADEICFYAKVKPSKQINDLTTKQVELLFEGIKKILNRAIETRGSSVDNYVDAGGRKGEYAKELKVYDRENEKCFWCKKKIKRIKLGGRSSYFCPHCQK